MNINIGNCIANQKHLDFHPKFWDKPEHEIREKLEACVKECRERIILFNGNDALNKLEKQMLEYAYRFIQIASPQMYEELWTSDGRLNV